MLTISLGSFLFFIPIALTFKLSTSFVFIGLYIVALFAEQPTVRRSLEMRTTVSACAWVFFAFIITLDLPVSVFFVFAILGFFIIKELVDPYISRTFRQKLNLLEISFIVIFALTITSTIIRL